MLEDRSINILAYNVETVLAEKIETMLVRSTLNTRMRDFYDMWALCNIGSHIDYSTLAKAVSATARAREHNVKLSDAEPVIDALAASAVMAEHWARYREKYDFASALSWTEALNSIRSLCAKAALA